MERLRLTCASNTSSQKKNQNFFLVDARWQDAPDLYMLQTMRTQANHSWLSADKSIAYFRPRLTCSSVFVYLCRLSQRKLPNNLNTYLERRWWGPQCAPIRQVWSHRVRVSGSEALQFASRHLTWPNTLLWKSTQQWPAVAIPKSTITNHRLHSTSRKNFLGIITNRTRRQVAYGTIHVRRSLFGRLKFNCLPSSSFLAVSTID